MAADPKDFWEAFGDSSELVEVTCKGPENLAKDVFDVFGIPCKGTVGGQLPNLDIKRMDAMQVVKLSLLEESANTGRIYEPIMNSEGDVEFVEIGGSSGLSGGDIYYELQTSTYREYCGGVMINGAKPMATRKPVEWHPIWGNGDSKRIYDTGIMISNCIQGDFNQKATITYNNPHLDSSYEDGIDNMYEIGKDNPYDSIIGWATYLYWDGWESSPDTVVKMSDTSTVLLRIENLNLGRLEQRPSFPTHVNLENAACMENAMADIGEDSDGVEVVLPEDFRYETIRGTKVDKFIGVEAVYIIGIEIDDMRSEPLTNADAIIPLPLEGSYKVIASISKTHRQVCRLSVGAHYVVAYKDMGRAGEKQPFIVFIDNSRLQDPITIDGKVEMDFTLEPTCAYAIEKQIDRERGFILPTSETSGFLVQEIHVAVNLESPSIEIYDPDGWNRKASVIAENLEYLVAPLVVVEEPAPIAYNGRLIDQVQSIRDHDPTTAQSFEDTDLEVAMDEMSGNGITLSLTFLDEDQCVKLSGALFDYLNSGDGTEATYICGPGTEAKLGGTAPNGGIVNGITYSYQDSNSYTISVNAGPVLLGNFSQISGGPMPKAMEEISAKGTIIEDMGNHVYFKVRIDGVGDRVAVNMAPTILRVGDKVQCSIHNNPVEI